jgi:hypothetical protein
MPGVLVPKPRKPALPPPGVDIIDDGRGVDLGGGVEGGWMVRGVRLMFGTAGEGEAARNRSRSAPESSPLRLVLPFANGLLRRRAERAISGEGVRGMRGGDDFML